MIRNVVSRPARATAAMAATAGIVALAGCSPSTEAAESDAGSVPAGDGTYVDGTYSADGSYATPESVESISVTVTLSDDVITEVQVVGDAQAQESQQYQSDFIGGISVVVVGQDIDEISVSRVAGSSLTSGGFNQAIDAIKAEAAA
ncbi:hypothetical protein [Microbacterium marmarense]|uniref:FMN-binding domain-containing protein n=1 Tax=Microbacterium marmarense TaxID=3122051 RepID=A0ABU8LUR0_9MICO